MERFNSLRGVLIVWVSFAICAAILVLATYGRTWRIDYKAQLSQLALCSGLDSNGTPVLATQPVTVDVKEIRVCGYLDGVGPDIPLWFLLEYNEDVLIDRVDRYQPGYISTYFRVPRAGLRTGSHSVLVYSGRHKIASMEFIVQRR